MESGSYQKFGRGGAGNYYSKQDIQEVQERAAVLKLLAQVPFEIVLIDCQDVEAQPTNERELRAAESTPAEFIHSGRGGAGNYSNAADAAERKRSVDMAPTTREHTVPQGGFYGRGGAGNLRGSEGDLKEEMERTTSHKQRQAYEKTVEDVEQGLRAPEKAHLANE
ncbi:MAG: hypothetical protein Q9207_003721 [Kuettlingeria erythrocarpa]